jgi:hypothetical protein
MATQDKADLPRAGDVYGPLLAEQLVVEMGHKASLEQRGLAVITTSGVLVSLLVALSALVLGRDSAAFLTGATRALMIAAVIVFVVAAGLGLLVNRPGRYWGLGPDDLDRIAAEKMWMADKGEAALLVGQQRVVELRKSMTENDRKAQALQRAITAEVIGVTLVAGAIVVALVR